MSRTVDAIIDALPAPGSVQLWADADSIAQALHEAQSRAVIERHLVPGVTAWADLPRAVRTARVAAVAELLERGILATPAGAHPQ